MIAGPILGARGVKLSFLDRRVLLITGKGGVGRTTVTVALGRAAARTGKKAIKVIIESKNETPRFSIIEAKRIVSS